MLLVTGLVEGWYDIGPKARAGAAALAKCAHLRRAPQVPGHQFTLFAVGMTSACGPRPLRARARPPVADRRARRAAFVPGSYAAFNLRAAGARAARGRGKRRGARAQVGRVPPMAGLPLRSGPELGRLARRIKHAPSGSELSEGGGRPTAPRRAVC